MKKILVNFVALHGGGTTYAYQMVNAMCESGCVVYAIVSSNMENIEKWRNIKNINLIEVNGYTNKLNFFPRLIYFKFFKLRKIYKNMKKINFDAIYIPFISFWTYTIFKKFQNYRTIYTMHDVYPHDNKTNTFIWKRSEKIAYKCSEIIILSDCFKDSVVKNYKKDSSKIYTIPLGHQAYYSDGLLLKKEIDYFQFVFYGKIEDYKGIDILAKAYKIISDKYDNVNLLLAGSGDLKPYQDLLDKINSKKIRIINRWILDDEVKHFFESNKNITLIPYKNATQSGIIPIAMSFKSLVISTNCSGLAEQVVDGKTGFLINPNSVNELVEKMEYVINNWSECGTIVENAQKYIEKFSWTNLVNELIEKI